MLQILEFTEAKLSTLTTRSELHGDDAVPAVSLGLELTTSNEILDLIDKELAPRLFKHSDSKSLPGVRDALTVLACNSIERATLAVKHEGWTLQVDDGVDDTKPLAFGGCKVDKVSVEPMQGGSVVLRMRIGTSDLNAAKSGMLGMHVGQQIWITLTAPKPGEERKDEKEPKGKAPDATDLFVEGAKGGDTLVNGTKLSPKAAWPFPKGADTGAPPAHLAEGMTKAEKTTAKRADAAAAKKKAPMKYRDAATGSTWSGRGLMPKWLKVAMERGKKLSDYEVAATH